jgi:ribose/xylose/arabinose/galactoside ABC-type transport system permease subunit
MRAFLRDNVILVILVLACVLFATQTAAFLTVSNWKNILINSSILLVVAVPASMLMIAGYVDLSLGSVVGLSGVVTSLAVLNLGAPAWAAILIGLGFGLLVGCVNGFLCAVVGFNNIIVTLGMLSIVRGATLLTTSSSLFGLGSGFVPIGRGSVFGIPSLVLVALAVLVVGYVFLTFSPWGRHIYAIGVNPRAAFLAGLGVRRVPFLLYAATGMAAALGGVLFAARLDGAAPAQLGQSMELMVLTAVLMGGVAFAGGRGGLLGVLFAVLLLGVVQNGLVLLNVSSFVQLVAQGTLLVLAAGLDRLQAWFGGRAALTWAFLGRSPVSPPASQIGVEADLVGRSNDES